MRKDNLSFEDKLKRLHVLSGIKPVNESRQGGTLSTVVETVKINETNYGIVKENGFYYIKSTKADTINESTLDYIGGLANKREYKFNSYSDALKNLNMMKINMQESFTPDEIEEDTDMDAQSDAGEEMGAPEMMEQLSKDIMGDQNQDPAQGAPEGMPPAPEAAPQAAPAPAPAPEAMPPAPEAAPAPQTSPDQDAEFAQGGGQQDQVDHFVGKLTGELRTNAESLDSDRLKGIINSVLAAIDLQKIDPDSRFEIGKRIKDGMNAQEDGGEEQNNVGGEPEAAPAPAPEAEPAPAAPEEEPMQEEVAEVNEVDDLKINEFFHNNRKAVVLEGSKLKVKNIMVETVGNKVILTKGDKSHTYNVSEKTIGKLANLIEHKATKLMNEEIANFFKKKI